MHLWPTLMQSCNHAIDKYAMQCPTRKLIRKSPKGTYTYAVASSFWLARKDGHLRPAKDRLQEKIKKNMNQADRERNVQLNNGDELDELGFATNRSSYAPNALPLARRLVLFHPLSF